MNRLQKKCLIATAGFHLLLVLVILFGAAFFTNHEKPDETTLLTVIPANLIDAAFNSGVKAAQPPAPTPPQPVQPPQPPQPQPEPVKPPDPEPVKPAPTFVERVTKIFTPDPPKLVPVDNTEPAPKPKPHVVKVDLKQVTHTAPKVMDTSEADAHAAAQAAKRRAAAIAKAARAIADNTSTATTVDMPGASSVSYASYKDALASIYYNAWTPPDDTANDDAITKVRVTIARDGTVISAEIIGASSDTRVDSSVQKAIDRVTSVPPLPGGESQRSIILNFNLKTKRMIG
jgi:TonB family protein